MYFLVNLKAAMTESLIGQYRKLYDQYSYPTTGFSSIGPYLLGNMGKYMTSRAGSVIENICIVTRGGMYSEILPDTEGNYGAKHK